MRAISLPDYAMLMKYLAKKPTLYSLVAALAQTFGVKIEQPKPANQNNYTTGDELKRLVEMTGGRMDRLAEA